MSGSRSCLKCGYSVHCHVRFNTRRVRGVQVCNGVGSEYYAMENASIARTLLECCAYAQVLTLCSALDTTLLTHTHVPDEQISAVCALKAQRARAHYATAPRRRVATLTSQCKYTHYLPSLCLDTPAQSTFNTLPLHW